VKPNMGTLDRSIRLAAGLAIIGAGVWFRSWWGAVGLAPIITAVTGWCVLYTIFGISTRGEPRAKS
jgi:hypothetical protein